MLVKNFGHGITKASKQMPLVMPITLKEDTMALEKSKSKSVTKGKKVIKPRLKSLRKGTRAVAPDVAPDVAQDVAPDVDAKKKSIVDAVMADMAESDWDDDLNDEEVEFDEVETKAKPKAKQKASEGIDLNDVDEVEVDQGTVYNISDMVSKKIQNVGGEKVYYNVQLRLPGYCEDLYKGIPPALRKTLREIFIEALREMYDQTRGLTR